MLSINLFVPNAPFRYPLKTSENRMVFWCFQVGFLMFSKGWIGSKWVKIHTYLGYTYWGLFRYDTHNVHENCPIFEIPYPLDKLLPKFFHTLDLERSISNEPTPLQMTTNQLKENVILGWLLCYQVFPSAQLSFSVSTH